MAKTLDKDLKELSSEVKKPISLDEIIHEYSELANELELGELTDEIIERLEINEQDVNRKMLGYRYIILNNDAKISSIYKPEIEKLQGRIKKFENTNIYLKGKVCQAAEIFGINGKYKSDTINVSAVENISLDTDETLVQESITEIKQCIMNNNTEDITVELELVKISLNINGSPELLAKIIDFYNNLKEEDTISADFTLSVNLDRKAAKELVQEVNEVNEGLDAALEAIKKEDPTYSLVPNYRTINFKGLSLKSSRYPRFS